MLYGKYLTSREMTEEELKDFNDRIERKGWGGFELKKDGLCVDTLESSGNYEGHITLMVKQFFEPKGIRLNGKVVEIDAEYGSVTIYKMEDSKLQEKYYPKESLLENL